MNTEYNNPLSYVCTVEPADFSINDSRVSVGQEVTLSESPTDKKILLGIKFNDKWQFNSKPISDFIYIEIEHQPSGKWLIIGASNPMFTSAPLDGAKIYRATPVKTTLSNEIPTKGEIVEIVNELVGGWTEETTLDLGTSGTDDGEFSYNANKKLLTPVTMI